MKVGRVALISNLDVNVLHCLPVIPECILVSYSHLSLYGPKLGFKVEVYKCRDAGQACRSARELDVRASRVWYRPGAACDAQAPRRTRMAGARVLQYPSPPNQCVAPLCTAQSPGVGVLGTPAVVAVVEVAAGDCPTALGPPSAPVPRVAAIAQRCAHKPMRVAVVPHAGPQAHAARAHELRSCRPAPAAGAIYAVVLAG